MAGGYRFEVHVDEGQIDAKGGPLPESVRAFSFGPEPAGEPRPAYIARMLGEVKALCLLEQARGGDGVALPQEGVAL